MTFVVAGGIVRSRGWIIERHCRAVVSNWPNALFYVTGDNNDDTEKILRGWRIGSELATTETPGPLIDFMKHDTGEIAWTRDGVEGPRYRSAHMAAERNLWAQEALKRWPSLTHLWIVDSDVLPTPGCLERLLEVDAPVAAAYVPVGDGFPIYMEGLQQTLKGRVGWDPSPGHPDGNRFTPSRTGNERHHAEPFECHLVGGAYLVKREVFYQGADGSFLGPWSEHPMGEDGGFQQHCHAYELKMMAVPAARCRHLMQRDDKEG